MNARSALLAAAVLAVSMGASQAQTQRTGNDAARVMQQVQQLTADKTRLESENQALKRELEEIKKKLDKSSSDNTALQQKARNLELAASRRTPSAEDAEALEKSRAQMQELVTRFRETANTLKEVEADRNQARGALGASERSLRTCIDRNAGLYELNAEILDRLENRGFWSSLSEQEPFTQLKRTQLENLIDDYRYRVEELRVERAANPSGG